MDQVKERGWIGVIVHNVDPNSPQARGLDKARGALITSVMPGGSADKGGIKISDIILSIDGKIIADTNTLINTIAAKTPGEKATMTVWRDAKAHELTLILGKRPLDRTSAQAQSIPAAPAQTAQSISTGQPTQKTSALTAQAAQSAVAAQSSDADKFVNVEAEGQGETKMQAMKAAWMEAVRLGIGMFLDAKTTVIDDAVKDEIVAHSRGRVDSYEELSSEKTDAETVAY